jgi:hypothetical protein
MKIVHVTYTTQAEYAEHNKANIRAVMQELQERPHAGIRYAVIIAADGKTFTHLAYMQDEEAQQYLNALEPFKTFLRELKESQPEQGPKAQNMDLVGSSFSIF